MVSDYCERCHDMNSLQMFHPFSHHMEAIENSTEWQGMVEITDRSAWSHVQGRDLMLRRLNCITYQVNVSK